MSNKLKKLIEKKHNKSILVTKMNKNLTDVLKIVKEERDRLILKINHLENQLYQVKEKRQYKEVT